MNQRTKTAIPIPENKKEIKKTSDNFCGEQITSDVFFVFKKLIRSEKHEKMSGIVHFIQKTKAESSKK